MSDSSVVNQIAENFRFYGDMRFKQLTLFMAAMTAASAGVIQSPAYRWWIALGALYFTGVMWVVEVRATLNAIAAHNAIPEVFPEQKKFWPGLASSFAVLSLHIACFALWLSCVRAWGSGRVCFYIGSAVGLGLTWFSIVNYKKEKRFWFGPR
jgi:hypothetical protein